MGELEREGGRVTIETGSNDFNAFPIGRTLGGFFVFFFFFCGELEAGGKEDIAKVSDKKRTWA